MGLLSFIKDNREKAKQVKKEKEAKKAEAEAKLIAKLQNISSGNNLPVASSEGILLQKNEICYYRCSASRYETKTKTVGYEGGYAGLSFKVTKGVTLHTGGTRGHAVKKEVGVEYPGMLYITSKRIIFVADKKHFVVNFAKIVGAKSYKDGFGVQTEKSTYNVMVLDAPYVHAILNGAITNFMNKQK